MVLLARKKQIIVGIEGAEGTLATLAATDGKMLVYDLSFEPNPNMFQRDPARSTLTPLKGIVGKQTVPISWRTELKGSGALATRPAWDNALRCCGFTSAAVSAITIGSVTSGPFEPAEKFTVTTTNQQGRVVGEISTGATLFHFVPTTGTVATGMTIVGSTSGASVVTNGALQGSKGWEYKPDSSSPPSASIGAYQDGTRTVGYGARGNVALEGNVGEPVFLAFNFDCIFSAHTDQALETITYESVDPQPLLDSGHRFDGATIPFAALSLDMQNTVAEREDARATKGIRSYKITERAPQISIDPEDVLVATKSYRTRMMAASTGYYFSKLGATAGNKITIGCPLIQYQSVGMADRNSLATAPIVFSCVASSPSTADGDKEVQLAMI